MDPRVPHSLEQLVAAVRQLFGKADLVFADPGERHVVSELFLLLGDRFPDHTVSNEYDRREQEIKTLGGSRIIPDLIVHQIRNQNQNLLVVEVKLAGNHNYESDLRKLAGMTLEGGEYGYSVGVHIVLNLPRRHVNRGHVYINGVKDEALTEWFEALFA